MTPPAAGGVYSKPADVRMHSAGSSPMLSTCTRRANAERGSNGTTVTAQQNPKTQKMDTTKSSTSCGVPVGHFPNCPDWSRSSSARNGPIGHGQSTSRILHRWSSSNCRPRSSSSCSSSGAIVDCSEYLDLGDAREHGGPERRRGEYQLAMGLEHPGHRPRTLPLP